MPVKLSICQSTSCSSLGAGLLIRDIEELALDGCEVEETLCLGRCGKGPNAEVLSEKGKRKIVEGVSSFKKAAALVEEEAQCEVSKAAKALAKIKYEVRREEDATKRNKALQKAFAQLGDEAKAEAATPELLSQLLVMRSGFTLKTDHDSAREDAAKAVRLTPRWAQAQLALGTACEASKLYAQGVKALEAALEIGKCIKVGVASRQLARLQKFAEEAAEAQAPPEGEKEAEPEAKPEPKPEPKAKARTNSRPKTKGQGKAKARAREDVAGSKPARPAAAKAVAAEPAKRNLQVEMEWLLESVERLNHDCLNIAFRAPHMEALTREEIAELWHVDALRDLEGGEELRRSYTPLSSAQEYKEGVIRLMVKVYPRGKMTSYLARLRPGSSVLLSPPLRTHELEGHEGMVMIAGGSSITVALQVCRSLLARYPMGVAVCLVLCNKTVEDVLFQDELEGLLQEHHGFSLLHCISDGVLPSSREGRAAWKAGRLSLEDLEENTSPSMRAVVSGPMGLCLATVKIWEKLGRDRQRLSILDELPPEEKKEEEEERTARGPVRCIVSL